MVRLRVPGARRALHSEGANSGVPKSGVAEVTPCSYSAEPECPGGWSVRECGSRTCRCGRCWRVGVLALWWSRRSRRLSEFSARQRAVAFAFPFSAPGAGYALLPFAVPNRTIVVDSSPSKWARDFRKDDSYRREDAVRLPEARERVRRLALLLTPPVFVVAGEPDRFVAVVRAPRVFFAAVRLLGRLVPARDSDLEAERCPPLVVRVGDFLLAGLPAWGCEEPDGADRPGLCRDGVPLDPANRISRSSSRPAATAPSIMPARSTCLSARRPLATA